MGRSEMKPRCTFYRHFFWTKPNNDIEILELNEKAAKEYGFGYGTALIRLTDKHIDALRSGKMLAWNDSEYSTFVVYEKPDLTGEALKDD